MGQVITIVVKDVANYTYLKQFQCYFTIKRNIFQSFFFAKTQTRSKVINFHQ